MSDLLDIAERIPSMGGAEIGDILQAYAEAVPNNYSIVEIGSWLGAGSARLKMGAEASEAPLCCYDRWVANRDQAEKAARFGVELEAGQDTLPLFRAAMESFPGNICFHKGEIQHAWWHNRPIGLYVDDASKVRGVWANSMKTFGRYFVPGVTVMVLMDYHYDEKAGIPFRAQKRYIRAHKDRFECLVERLPDGMGAVFRYLG